MEAGVSIDKILAIVVLEETKHKIMNGGAPIIVAADEEERQHVVLLLSRILKAMAHDLENGVYIIVKH